MGSNGEGKGVVAKFVSGAISVQPVVRKDVMSLEVSYVWSTGVSFSCCSVPLGETWGGERWVGLSLYPTNPLAFLRCELSSRVQPWVLNPSPALQMDPLLRGRAVPSGHERGHTEIGIAVLV